MADDRPTGATLQLPGIEDLQEVNHGGFASVYRGWQPAFGRWVAVKVLNGAPVNRLHHEARAVGSLSEHPHVVPVYEAGQIEGRPYLVMPYLTGGSLQDRIRRGPLSPVEALATGQAVADALSEAHRLGILHRDIKPANILFTAYGVPQLGDFGVARLADATLTGGMLTATVAYAAPEVLSGEPATPLSDVYSLGATLYAALCGAPPFASRDGELAVAHAMRVVHDDPISLEQFGVPAPVAALVARAMAKDPARRYASAAEMSDALAGRARTGTWGPPAGVAREVPPAAPNPAAAGTATYPADPPRPADPQPAPARHRHRPSRLRELRPMLAAAAAVIALAGAGTAVATALSGGAGRHHPAAAHATTTVPATTAPATTPATSTRTSGSAAAGYLPPSAGTASTPAEIPPSVLADTLRAYYALVDQHRLDQSWAWLSPAFQDRIGAEYYHQFWDGISQVQVIAVHAAGGAAQITLHYVKVDGASSTETTMLGFAIGSDHRILIDTDRATSD